MGQFYDPDFVKGAQLAVWPPEPGRDKLLTGIADSENRLRALRFSTRGVLFKRESSKSGLFSTQLMKWP